MGDAWAGRWPSLDPADQFQSMTGYGYMANNSVSLTDPDGRYIGIDDFVAGLVGGALNVAANWSKIKKTGGLGIASAYFVSGAAGGVVSLYGSPLAGGAVTGAANAVIDIATGNAPELKNGSTREIATYIAEEAAWGLTTSYIGGKVGELVGPSLQGVFKWTQSTFVNATQQTIMIGGKAYTYFVDAGVKLSKSLFQSVGGVFGKGGFDAVNAFRNAISPFKGEGITNAGRAVTKHPEYFGFDSNNALRQVYRTDTQINNLASQRLKDVLRNGQITTGIPTSHYPSGWITYTLQNGNAASWGLNGQFIGFRGIR